MISESKQSNKPNERKPNTNEKNKIPIITRFENQLKCSIESLLNFFSLVFEGFSIRLLINILGTRPSLSEDDSGW